MYDHVDYPFAQRDGYKALRTELYQTKSLTQDFWLYRVDEVGHLWRSVNRTSDDHAAWSHAAIQPCVETVVIDCVPPASYRGPYREYRLHFTAGQLTYTEVLENPA